MQMLRQLLTRLPAYLTCKQDLLLHTIQTAALTSYTCQW